MSAFSGSHDTPSAVTLDPCPECGTPCATCAADPSELAAATIVTFDDGLELPPGGRLLVRVWRSGLHEADLSFAGESWGPVVFRGGRAELAP